MTNCDGMEMPQQTGDLDHSMQGSPCCQLGQTATIQFQQSSARGNSERYASINTPHIVPASSMKAERVELRCTVSPPPDRQSLFCTLLI